MNKEYIEVLKAAHHMMWVWEQYSMSGAWSSKDNEHENAPDLYHACMSAGEDACEWLEGMGLAYDSGSYCVLTQKGIDVYNAESQEDFQTIAFKAYK